MTIAPPLYPSVHLPPWPSQETGENKHQNLSQLVDALPGLGFEVLFNDEFESLDQRLSAKLDQVNRAFKAKNPAAQRPIWSHCPTEHWTQLWRHPAGILVQVERYRQGSFKDWQFNRIRLTAEVDAGFGHPKDGDAWGHSRYGACGERLMVIKAQQDLGDAWREVSKAAAEGRLTPFSRWPSELVGKDFLLHQQHAWELPKLTAGTTPSGLVALQPDIIAKAASALGRKRLQCIASAQLPDEEKQHWRFMVGATVSDLLIEPASSHRSSVAPGNRDQKIMDTPIPGWALKLAMQDGAPDPRAQKTIKHLRMSLRRGQGHVVFTLHRLLERFGMQVGDPLSASERKTIGVWLDQLVDPRHPAHRRLALDAAHAQSLDRFGLKFHHLLLACASVPAAMRLARDWQNHQSPQALVQACVEPEKDGLTLPMRWAHAWLDLPNSRAYPRRLEMTRNHAARGLEQLKSILPVSQWCLASSRASVWDEALDIQINAAHDDDLLPHYQAGLHGFMRWLSAQDAALPTTAFLPGRSEPVCLDDPHQMQDALAQHDPNEYRGSPSDRVRLLGPLVALAQGQVLQQAAPRSNGPKSRTRL